MTSRLLIISIVAKFIAISAMLTAIAFIWIMDSGPENLKQLIMNHTWTTFLIGSLAIFLLFMVAILLNILRFRQSAKPTNQDK